MPASRYGRMNRTIFRHVMPQRVTILPKPTGAGITDEYGNITESEWPTSGVEWPARVHQGPTNEDRNRRQSTLYNITAVLPPSAEVANGDRLLWEGRQYLVEGVRSIQHPMWGTPHHLKVGLVRET